GGVGGVDAQLGVRRLELVAAAVAGSEVLVGEVHLEPVVAAEGDAQVVARADGAGGGRRREERRADKRRAGKQNFLHCGPTSMIMDFRPHPAPAEAASASVATGPACGRQTPLDEALDG